MKQANSICIRFQVSSTVTENSKKGAVTLKFALFSNEKAIGNDFSIGTIFSKRCHWKEQATSYAAQSPQQTTLWGSIISKGKNLVVSRKFFIFEVTTFTTKKAEQKEHSTWPRFCPFRKSLCEGASLQASIISPKTFCQNILEGEKNILHFQKATKNLVKGIQLLSL
jgi:hypothetical protein